DGGSIGRGPDGEGRGVTDHAAQFLCGRHRIKFLLAEKNITHRLRDFIATCPDCRTDAREDILRSAAKSLAHRLDRCGYNASGRATPAAVSYTNHSLHRIIEDDGDAVGKREGNRNLALPRDQGICLADR